MQDPNPRTQIFILFCVCLAVAFSCAPSWSMGAADYRKLADSAVKSGQYALAADYFRQEAAVYDKLGAVTMLQP